MTTDSSSVYKVSSPCLFHVQSQGTVPTQLSAKLPSDLSNGPSQFCLLGCQVRQYDRTKSHYQHIKQLDSNYIVYACRRPPIPTLPSYLAYHTSHKRPCQISRRCVPVVARHFCFQRTSFRFRVSTLHDLEALRFAARFVRRGTGLGSTCSTSLPAVGVAAMPGYRPINTPHQYNGHQSKCFLPEERTHRDGKKQKHLKGAEGAIDWADGGGGRETVSTMEEDTSASGSMGSADPGGIAAGSEPLAKPSLGTAERRCRLPLEQR